MTCIAGVEHDGKVWIGGDSAGVAGFHLLTVRADEKVWTQDGFAFGFTSSFRMGQILRYSMTLPLARYEVEQSAAAEIKFMSTTFVDAVRAALKTGGYARNESGEESGGTFLVGWRGRLYCVESDFQVGRAAQGFQAVGCGGSIAEGALFALNASAKTAEPAKRIRTALEAAQALNAGVRAPFKVVHV